MSVLCGAQRFSCSASSGLCSVPLQPSAHALSFNLTFDDSTVGAPAEFFTAFNDAIQFYETNFTDPITINLQVGWGEVTGQNADARLSRRKLR